MVKTKGEKLEKSLASKDQYFYFDDDLGIRQLSREVHKNRDEIVHYPRGFEGGPKYQFIKKFIFKEFKGSLSGLVGVNKSYVKGYGFTKGLRPFGSYVDGKLKIQNVLIDRNGPNDIDLKKKILHLNPSGLRFLHDTFSKIYRKNSLEVDRILGECLYSLFPSKIPKPKSTYIKNSIATSILTWTNSIKDFSEDDETAIKDLFNTLSLSSSFFSKDSLATTKEIVDSKFIAGALDDFSKLLAIKGDGSGLEKKWQNLLRTHSWIFSSIFAQPVILFQDEAFVGGKTIDNKNGKINDFLIQNSLSDNVSFVELKTHKTKLLDGSAYRGKDVFGASRDLSGCIVQVLDQRDNFQKEFYSHKAKLEVEIEAFNPKCLVIIGTLSDLNKDQRHSFELFRSNCRDIEILTFDELYSKIKSLQKLVAEGTR